jgi:hypothetical protein
MKVRLGGAKLSDTILACRKNSTKALHVGGMVSLLLLCFTNIRPSTANHPLSSRERLSANDSLPLFPPRSILPTFGVNLRLKSAHLLQFTLSISKAKLGC